MDDKEKIESLIDELYVLHKGAGERMLKLGNENKKVVDNMHKIQIGMETLFLKQLEKEKKGNNFIVYVMFVSLMIVAGFFVYSMLSMKSKVTSYTEVVERQSDKLYKLASDMNYVMNELYKEQKQFLKENKCNID